MADDRHSEPKLAKWQHATVEMVDQFAAEELFDEITSVYASDLGDAIYGKLREAEDTAVERPLLDMLASILTMHETPSKTPPFGPMIVWADGSRSAAPEDFAGPLVDVIVATLHRISHPVARARLSHLAWFIERRRREEGLGALNAYIDVLHDFDAGRLKARGERTALSATGRDILKMAFRVSHGLGRPEAKHQELKALAADFLKRVGSGDDVFALHIFSELTLDEQAMSPEDIATIVETFIDRASPVEGDNKARMHLLAARAHKQAKDDSATNAAVIRAAECFAAHAELFVNRDHGSMLAAHWMGTAVRTLAGVPNVRERRQELKHRLVDIQGSIPDELMPISHSTDISDLVEDMRKQFSGKSLSEALRRLTITQGISPAPEKLEEDARRAMAEHPLLSIFETSHMDAEGKTVARSPGGGIGVDDVESQSFETIIAQAESVRRGFTARACIEVGRSTIMTEHRVSEELIFELLRCSPAVPSHLARTAARGVVRWFEGDMVSALYILTPLLEGILRYLLKQHGHDVTTYNDANNTQEDRTITALYDALRPQMDEILGRHILRTSEGRFSANTAQAFAMVLPMRCFPMEHLTG